MTGIPVITIDGPSGSGKGTVAVSIAEELGFTLLDSGALYRSDGIAALRDEIDLGDHQKIAELA
ncbi:MAG: (d)CMP kinase, partial [Pseudomonadales bacterium]|nr:(d)CMP kinase [Pseudomonadales bacterium]